MSPAVDVVERLVIQRKLRHRAHAVLQLVRSQCRRHPGPGRRSQIRQGQKLWADCALVALAMALFFALLRAAKPTDIEALIG